MFNPQTTEIRLFKVERFLTQYHFIIYDISADFGILFGMWNSIVPNYPCAKFHHDMAIDNGIN